MTIVLDENKKYNRETAFIPRFLLAMTLWSACFLGPAGTLYTACGLFWCLAV